MKKVRHWWRFETRFHSHQAVVGVVVSVHSLLILVDWRQERCWKTIPTSKGLYCQSVGGLNEESKALVAIRDEISFSPGCCWCCCGGPFTFDFGRLASRAMLENHPNLQGIVLSKCWWVE